MNDWLHSAEFVSFVWIFGVVILSVQGLQNAIYLIQLGQAVPAFMRARRRTARLREWWLLGSRRTPPISLLVPGYNEEATVVESVKSMLTLKYPELQIIVVNDGSKDATMQRLIDAFHLKPIVRAIPKRVIYQKIRAVYGCERHPSLLVIDKDNGGKADALNAALDLATSPLVCSVDADSLLDSGALLKAVRPFIDDPERTAAVGGTIRVVNGCRVKSGQVTEVKAPRQALELMQAVEYTRAFLMARMAWTRSKTVTIISGAFGIFKRESLLALNGYSHGTVGEDMELVVRLHKHAAENEKPIRIWHVPDPVCWTEVPDNLRVLSRQRTRWQRGLCETLWRHKRMIGNCRYGSVGLVALPQFLLFDVIGPILEVTGLLLVPLCWLLGILSLEFFLAYCALVFAFGACISLFTFILSELALQRFRYNMDLWLMAVGAIIENFGYRQLNSLWRVQGIWQFLRKKEGWGKMTRKGFKTQ